jgi:hypothetical protein
VIAASSSARESHHRFAIGRRERDAGMRNVLKALADVGIEEPARGALRDFFERSSAHMSRGANIDPRGSRGLTAAQAARTAAMRQLVLGRRRPADGDD